MNTAPSAAGAADDLNARIEHSVRTLRERLAGWPVPEIAVVLGSGWGAAADGLQDAVDVPYAELPAFPVLGVQGHSGLLRVGRVGPVEGPTVALLRGRKHAYERGDAGAMKGAIRTLAALGVRTLVLTNAAGSLDRALPPGSLMLVRDHLNLVQATPLLGETDNHRFVDMGQAYDPALRAAAANALQASGRPVEEGVLAWVLGPQFETPAEIRMLGLLGARAVGMSVVPETILARHAGLRVLGLTLITNLAAGLADEVLSHEQTLSVARASEGSAAAMLLRVLGQLLESP
jgi:purine-nucleoside phosphorylase